MRIIDVIKIYRNVLLHIGYTLNVQNVKNNKFLEGRYRGEIIRNVHSIEKGLCIENPRKFFGMEKIEKMLQQADRYMSIQSSGPTYMMTLLPRTSSNAITEVLNELQVGFARGK